MNAWLGKHTPLDPRKPDDPGCQWGTCGVCCLFAQAPHRNTEHCRPSDWGLAIPESTICGQDGAPQPLMCWPTISQRKQTGNWPLRKTVDGALVKIQSGFLLSLELLLGLPLWLWGQSQVLNRWRSALCDTLKTVPALHVYSHGAPSPSRSNKKINHKTFFSWNIFSFINSVKLGL